MAPALKGEDEMLQLPLGLGQEKTKTTYQVGAAKVTVWENKRQGENGGLTVKSFEIEKVYMNDGQWKTTNQFDETEVLQLKAAIDKAINEENVTIKEGTETDTTKTNKE